MKFDFVFRGAVRCLVAVAATIVALDGFAQGRLGRPNQLRSGMNSPAKAAPAAPATTAAESDSDKTANREVPALNWDAAPVDIVLQAYADQLDRTYLKDPAVPNATITLKSREGQKMTQEEYLEAIEVVLEMNGIHVEPYGEKFVRVLPRKDARKEGIPLIMDPETKLNESGRVVSMMIPFKNIGTEEAQKALEGFKSNNGILLVFERTNSILATDTEQNINRMLEIARTIDISSPVLEQVYVRQIKHAVAADIKTALEAIVQESQKELEKDGKGSKVAGRSDSSANQSRPFGSRLLGNKKNDTPEPVNNQSLIMTVSDADRGMIRGKVLILADDRSNKLVIITQPANMKFFDSVIEQLDIETTPDTVVKVYRLKYANAEEVSDMINDLIGNAASSKSSGKENANRNAKSGSGSNVTRGTSPTAANAQRKSANQRSGEAKAGELSKDNTTVLADKRINGLIVMTEKELVPTVEQIIESMDVKLSQVLIETVIIEVTLGDGLSTGIDWVQNARKHTTQATTDALGRPTYYAQRTVTDSDGNTSISYLDKLVPAGWKTSGTTKDSEGNISTWVDEASSLAGSIAGVSTDGLLNYFTAGSATAIGAGQGGKLAYSAANNIVSNFFGKALNFVFTSDELGISAILQATKTDSRSKYIASPIIMTLDNKEATINATQMRYILKGFTSTGNSYSTIAVPDYEQKELGIEIKCTPKINPNGTVMLTVEEKYTQLGSQQSIKYSTGTGGSGATALADVPVDTTITREMSSDVLLENNQTVVFAGLTETTKSESESGIPILKDIPWIGKWLFGTVDQNEYRTELLVFMTPYVLNDAEATQAEALRRKRTLSDANPWDDRGWSLSELADPVSKKEQLRRLKDEWKKQDDERKTRIALEQEKVKRVKELEKMSKEERKLWLDMHKDELEDEEQDELEEKMLDEKSQSELKKLAAEVRERKLKEAEAALKQAEDETAADNERAKADRAKSEPATETEVPAEAPAVPAEAPAAPAAEPAAPAAGEEKTSEPLTNPQ